ncbi:hypothetical protein MTO96_038185, partial [Rhipicephalus appendiculatus]
RGDKELDETCVVCSRHFDDRYVQRTFKHVINGEVVEIDRERPALTDDAVPTIFPDAPSYLTKAVPRKRKERSIADCETPSAKRMTPSKNDVASQDFGDEGVGDDAAPAPLHPFQQHTGALVDFLAASGLTAVVSDKEGFFAVMEEDAFLEKGAAAVHKNFHKVRDEPTKG